MEIGVMLKDARSKAGLTQEQSAEKLGVSRQTVSNWETGKSYPDIVSVIRMSNLYDVSLDHLLKEETSAKRSYTAYLEESTKAVQSSRSKSIRFLVCVTLSFWVLSLVEVGLYAFSLDSGRAVGGAAALMIMIFSVVSMSCGRFRYFGRARFAAPIICCLLQMISSCAALAVIKDQLNHDAVMLFKMLPLVVLLITGISFGVGILVRKRYDKKKRKNDFS